MGKVARLIYHIMETLHIRKRKSIEGRKGGAIVRRDISLEVIGMEEKDVPPPSPGSEQASSPMDDLAKGDVASLDVEAEDCVEWEEWNAPAQDVPIDSVGQFKIDGGDDSSSSLCEEEVKEMRRTREKVSPEPAESVFYDHYEEEEFGETSFFCRREMPPMQAKALQLNSPDTCSHDEWKTIGKVYAAAMGKEDGGLDGRKVKWEERTRPTNVTYVVDDNVSPSYRPSNATTNAQTNIPSPVLSDEHAVPSEMQSDTVVVRHPTISEPVSDETNDWLRSLFERRGLAHEIPPCLAVDSSKEAHGVEGSSVVEDGGRAERRWMTSTPMVFHQASPNFHSASTIGGRLFDSAESKNYSVLDRVDETFIVERGERVQAALNRPMQDYLRITFGIDD